MSFWVGVVAGLAAALVLLLVAYVVFVFWLMKDCP